MLHLFSNRKVSQERVIGISFVDILIQAVFVLLVALMAGYVDPVERLKIEQYEELGKDLCKKINQDSPEACREYVQLTQLAAGEFSKIGENLCPRLGASDAKTCAAALDKLLGSGSQLPCLKTVIQNATQPSTRWEVRSPSEVVFLGFTSQYRDYLVQKADQRRQAAADRLQEQVPLALRPEDVAPLFDFIREPECFHSYSAPWTGKYSEGELKEVYRSLSKLRNFLK